MTLMSRCQQFHAAAALAEMLDFIGREDVTDEDVARHLRINEIELRDALEIVLDRIMNLPTD